MNIDERLEALTQSVELLAAMHKDHERQFEEQQRQFDERHRQFEERQQQFEEHKRLVTGAIESIAETQRQLAENDRKLTQLVAGMSVEQKDLRDAIIRLSVIAEAHQDTLDDHEKRLAG
jgi:chromosome segregation ATPase